MLYFSNLIVLNLFLRRSSLSQQTIQTLIKCCILGLHCLQKHPFRNFQSTKGKPALQLFALLGPELQYLLKVKEELSEVLICQDAKNNVSN